MSCLKGYSGDYAAFEKEWMSAEDYVLAHTSGSTGAPKEIRLPKSDMRVSARATNRFFGIGRDSILFSPLSAGYIAGKMMIARACEAGCTLYVENPSNRPLQQPFKADRIDLMCVVPSQASSLLTNGNAHRILKNLIVGGAPMPAELEEKLMSMPWTTYATYGMTETCSHVALRKVGESFFHAMPGVAFSTDKRRCLVINSDEYSFRSLVTNDVVELCDETQFRWLGRADNVINSGGVKFHPEELERILSHKLRLPFYIHAVSHPVFGETVGITIECSDPDISEEYVKDLCAECLPHYAVPREVRILSVLPRTASGKILRR